MPGMMPRMMPRMRGTVQRSMPRALHADALQCAVADATYDGQDPKEVETKMSKALVHMESVLKNGYKNLNQGEYAKGKTETATQQ
eukprot:14730217-Alexandrium_andersonii.AAC.1